MSPDFRDKVIVAMLCDSGERYLTVEGLWGDAKRIETRSLTERSSSSAEGPPVDEFFID